MEISIELYFMSILYMFCKLPETAWVRVRVRVRVSVRVRVRGYKLYLT